MEDMKANTEQKLSRWIPVIISFMMSAFTIGVTWGVVKAHIKDRDVHMPMSEKMVTFMPRTEIEKDMDHLRDDVQEMKEMVRKIYERGE